MFKSYSMELGGRTLTLEFGKYAEQASGATFVRYGDTCIRFKGPYSLKRFLEVKTYEDGYMVVTCEIDTLDGPQEDYIDMEYIAERLYMDASFLKETTRVEIGEPPLEAA